jgi:Na+-translocating ferredoxin:NAD+ oxidoreductase RnfG subunit
MYVGDEIMKKTIIWVLFALLSGALLGKITFDRYEKIDTKNVISYNNYVYMLKYGSYKTVDDMTNKITNIDRYVYITDENKTTAYISISKTKENLNKLKKIYDAKKINPCIKKPPKEIIISSINGLSITSS